MEIFNPNDFQNWLPSKLLEKEGELFLEWIYLWDVPFDMPFFDETIAKCLTNNSMKGVEQKVKRVTSIDFLSEVAKNLNFVDPGLFIFHTSRCGSTMTTQILSMYDQNIVYPEYVIVDAILRAHIQGNPVPVEKRKVWLSELIKIMGQKRLSKEKHVIIKLDSWHFCFHNLIRELYPDVPFAILSREPEAILSSNNIKWGMQFIPEVIPPSIFNLETDILSPFSLIEYANLVLQKMYTSILEIVCCDKNILLLDYSNGVNKNLLKLTQILNMDPLFMKKKEVIERLKYDSKCPTVNFIVEKLELKGLASQETIYNYNKLNDLILTSGN